jgi:hypothetical protein
VNHRPSPPRMTDEQIRQLLAAEQGGAKPDCFLCGMPVTVLRATLEIGKEEETRVVTMYPCEHRWSYNVRVAEQIDGQMRAAAATEATNGPAELAGENPAADAPARGPFGGAAAVQGSDVLGVSGCSSGRRGDRLDGRARHRPRRPGAGWYGG